jgi:tetratricopeptide (TPR) repeat protein
MAAPGRFVLLLAKCNLPAHQEALVVRLRTMLEPLSVKLTAVGLKEPVEDLLSHLKIRLEWLDHRLESVEGRLFAQFQPVTSVAEPRYTYSAQPPVAISVHGLEASLRSGDPHPPLLRHLNLARERYRDLGCPLVLWLPDYALTRLAQEAPDFWAWRSGVFEFAAEPALAESALRRLAQEPDLVTSNLNAVEKRERLITLEQLLADWRELEEGPQERRAQSIILHQLGILHEAQGEYKRAQDMYEHSLVVAQELDDRAGISTSLHHLGNLQYLQGEYKRAREMYEQSLAIAQDLGDSARMACSMHQLGILLQHQGEYERARELYKQSLAIAQNLGDRVGMARSLHQLGNLHYLQGEYERAREHYKQSLAIAEDLGDRAHTASDMHQLGILLQHQREYERARGLYEQSLAIAQDLGDRVGMARSLHQLGVLFQHQSAVRHHTQARGPDVHELGMLLKYQREYEQTREMDKQAREHYKLSLEIAQDLGDRAGMARSLYQLGNLHYLEEEFERAREHYEQSLEIAQDLGDRVGMARILHQLGILAEKNNALGMAEKSLVRSLTELEAVSSPDAAIARHSLERVQRERQQQTRSQA